MEDLTGKILRDRYRVEAFFGHGGMADVYKVWDQQRAVHLALKVLHDDLAEDTVFLRRFKREAQVLERLQHPNIVRFYGLEEWDGLAYILMDFIDGLTLRKEIFLNKKGLRPARVLQVAQPVCAALHYAHQMGLVHCDIKPANIMIHRNGTVYLADFGIARVTEGRTQSLPSAGTPAYMAPEIILGGSPTPAADIYALGVVIYEMLTGGERPFTGESAQTNGNTTQRIVWEKNNLDAPPPSRFNHNITPELEAVTLHCLERDPDARFASVMDLSHLLEQAVHGEGDNLEIQTLVDIQKIGEKSQAPLLNPAWLSSVSQPAPENSFSTPGLGDVPQSPAPEAEEAGEPIPFFSEEVPAAVEGAAPASTGESLPAAVPRRTHRTWIAVGIAAISLLALLLAFSLDRKIPLPAPVSAGANTSTASATASTTPSLPTETALPPATQAPQIVPPTSVPTPTPEPTALGGGPGKIAFASDRSGTVQVWIMDSSDPDPALRQQVTDIEGGACQPAWSPDGRQIAFVTPCNGPRLTYPGAKIKVIDLETHEIRDLNLHGGAFEPDWSPDGKTIAYTTFLGTKTVIYAVDLETLETRPLSTRGNKNENPDWSSDGEYLAFTSDEKGIDEIWMMREDGSSQQMLTQAGLLKYFTQPDWSADRTRLLAAMKEINQPAPVNVLVVLDRASPRQGGDTLLGETMRMEDGVFSPDGHWVAFWTVMEGDNLEILMVGSNNVIRRLTDHKARDFQPAWRPAAPQGK